MRAPAKGDEDELLVFSDGRNLVSVCRASIGCIDQRPFNSTVQFLRMRTFCLLPPLPVQHSSFAAQLLKQLSFSLRPAAQVLLQSTCTQSLPSLPPSLPPTAVTFRTSRELHLRGCVSSHYPPAARRHHHHPPLTHFHSGCVGKHEVSWDNPTFVCLLWRLLLFWIVYFVR